MVNEIKSGFYRISKSKAFMGVIIFCLLDLLLAIFMNKALYGSRMMYGASSLEASFMSNDTLPIIFMLFLAILISEDYSSGVIKNVIGKGIGKAKYYMSNILIVTIIAILAMILYSVILTTYYTVLNGFGSIENLGNIIIRSIGYIAILVATMCIVATAVIVTKKSMSALIIGAGVLYIPSALNIVAKVMNIKFNFEVIGINYYRSLLTSQGFEPKVIFQVIFVAACYSILAIVIGNIILKKQDIK